MAERLAAQTKRIQASWTVQLVPKPILLQEVSFMVACMYEIWCDVR